MFIKNHLGQWFYKLTVALVICLPFLVPFADNRNTDLQGIIILIIGLSSWLTILLKKEYKLKNYSQLELILLATFILFCIISLILNNHVGYDILGAPYIRLGSAALISCVGCGIVLSNVPIKKIITYIYLVITAAALISIPYELFRFGSLLRIGGIFSQADIFAVFLGCGILIGITLLKLYPHLKIYLYLTEIYFFILLILTQTRVVLYLVVLMCIYLFFQSCLYKKWSILKILIVITGFVLLIIGAKILLPPRTTNISYAGKSVSYRYSLQKYAVKSVEQKPIYGFGPGNLADALACKKLTAASLEETCQNHFFFNSSHNIFIDRFLALGLIGGLSYLILVAYEITRGLRLKSRISILGMCGLLISLYYLTNVTSIYLELLLWVIIMQIAIKSKKSNTQ